MTPMILKSNPGFVRRILLTACIAALAAAFMVTRPHTVQASKVALPSVPQNIQVPAGNVPFLVGHATGTQNYVCLPSAESASGVAFRLFTPQATLFDNSGGAISTHFFSPNPAEAGTIRAAWQDAKDTSSVWGQVQPGHSSNDPAFVAPGSIPWLLVTAVGSQNGPSKGDRLTKTTYIQRVNTAGGIAPAVGCNSPADVGNQAFVPYTTDYYFYRAAQGN